MVLIYLAYLRGCVTSPGCASVTCCQTTATTHARHNA